MAKHTRRSFLKKAAHTAAATGVGSQLVTPLDILKSDEPYWFETEKGRFTLYTISSHNIGGRTEVKKSFNIDPSIHDAVLLETGSERYEEHLGRNGVLDYIRGFGVYDDVVQYAEGNDTTILFADVPVSLESTLATRAVSSGVSAAAAVGGAEVALRDDKDEGGEDSEGKGLTRRRLVKGGAAAAALWGTAGLNKFWAAAANELSRQGWADELRRAAHVGEVIHPEDLAIVFRNAVIAEKLLMYVEDRSAEEERKVDVAIAMGGAHELLAEYVKEGRGFCQRVISVYPDELISKVFDEEYIARMAEIRVEGGEVNVNIIVDRELQGVGGVEGNYLSPEERG